MGASTEWSATSGDPRGEGRTRWRRFAALLIPAVAAAAVLVVAVAQGGLAASFAVSGHSFKTYAATLSGTGYATYPAVLVSADGGRHPVVILAVRSAQVTGMCQSTRVHTPLGDYVVRIGSAHPDTPTEATDLFIAADDITAQVDYRAIQINRDAATLDSVPGAVGTLGAFGIQAVRFRATDIKARAWSATGGSLQVSGLHLAVGPHVAECF